MDTPPTRSVLVTGSSGFIGSRLVRRLIEQGRRVTCLVRGTPRSGASGAVGARAVVGDVTDRESVARALAESQAGVVFHVAGLIRAVRAGDFRRVNAGGVENLAAVCAARSDTPVLVVVSSLAAAGPCGRRGDNRIEDDEPTPVSNYGRSKLEGERAAATYAERVPITIVRPPIVFGPGDRAVLEMFRPIARSGIHVVPGGGERRFSLIHVDDLVEGLMRAAEKGERLGQSASLGRGIYFMSAEETPTYSELGQAMALALGRERARVVRIPPVFLRLIGVCGDLKARVRGRPVWITRDKITEALAGSWTCSSGKAHTQLGWSLTTTLADRLHETARWYRQTGWL